MGREFRGAAIEGQGAPATTESGNAAVPILDTEQPPDAGRRGRDGVGIGLDAGSSALRGGFWG